MRVFGSLEFAHVNQGELDARVVKCVFIGYLDVVKGYKLWRLDLRESKCFISRDVTFDETRVRMMCKILEGSD